MRKKVVVKSKKKEAATTRNAVRQLNLGVAYAQEGLPEAALRCANNAGRILKRLAADLKKARIRMAKAAKK